MTKPIIERFEENIIADPESDCWLWGGSLHKTGYGSFFYYSDRDKLAHRAAYRIYVGPIPDGMDLDHLCRVRACVNPAHLEPVSRKENLRRGRGPTLAREKYAARTHCKNGHPYTEESLRMQLVGQYKRRVCRICHKAYMQERRDKCSK